MTQTELESKIKVALGGTIAEEIVFAEISNGATNDLEHSQSHCAAHGEGIRHELAGPRQLSGAEQARPSCRSSHFGEGEAPTTARRPHAPVLTDQVRRIIDSATEEVRTILQTRRAALEAVARRLIEKEVIDGTDLRAHARASGAGPRLRAPDSFPNA